MKHLFIIRHGMYMHGCLTTEGHEYVESVAKQMKCICQDGSIKIVTSPVLRAFQTAQVILGEFPKATLQRDNLIGDKEGGDLLPEEFKELDDLVINSTEDALALTTHFEVIREYPAYFLQHHFRIYDELKMLGMGQAFHFDLERRAYRVLLGR